MVTCSCNRIEKFIVLFRIIEYLRDNYFTNVCVTVFWYRIDML